MRYPIAYFMVGLPGSGKSTIADEVAKSANLEIVSADAFIEEYAASKKKTYVEVFREAASTAEENVKKTVARIVEEGKSFIWDQTNLTINTRARRIEMLSNNYVCKAIIVVASTKEVLADRLAGRPGKKIPNEVLQNMISTYQEPSAKEGFDTIYRIMT